MLFERKRPQVERIRFDSRLAGSRNRVLDVVGWPSGDAGVEMTLLSTGVRLRVLSLLKRGQAEATGFAALPAPSIHRDVAAATWPGSTPDLFLIDRGGSRERLRITVWKGETGFRRRIGNFRAPLRDLNPRRWILEVARLTGRRPDLVALSRGARGAKPEVHVLTGDSAYGRFALETSLGIGRLPAEVFGGATLGRAGLFMARRRAAGGATLLTVPLVPARAGAAP